MSAPLKSVRIRLPIYSPASHPHYQSVAKAIAYLRENVAAQPTLPALAKHVGMSPQHLVEVFHRWAGVRPKQFLKVLTLSRAKPLLEQNLTTLETSLECGLSGTSRLHDLFVTFDAISPDEYKRRGHGLTLHWGLHPTPFGPCLAVISDCGLHHLSFPEDSNADCWIKPLQRQWSGAQLIKAPTRTELTIQRIFHGHHSGPPIALALKGTPFQLKVWQALLEIPLGHTAAYSKLAEAIAQPSAWRATASAVGDNPVAYLIPCHRVLRKNLALGGYRWGLDRKTAMLATELPQ